MALWSSSFYGPASEKQERTRQRIVQETLPGKRLAQEIITKPEYMAMLKGQSSRTICDPWPANSPPQERVQKNPPIVGYAGHVSHTAHKQSGSSFTETQASFLPPRSREQVSIGVAPGGGSPALGIAPMRLPGSRTSSARLGVYESLKLSEQDRM